MSDEIVVEFATLGGTDIVRNDVLAGVMTMPRQNDID